MFVYCWILIACYGEMQILVCQSQSNKELKFSAVLLSLIHI